MRRVVITGMGIITALGCGVDINWKNLISSVSGIKTVDSFKVDDMPSKIAGEVSEKFIDRNFSDKDKRKMDKFILYSLIASEEAINNSGATLDFSNSKNSMANKHSTGGIGSKVSPILGSI